MSHQRRQKPLSSNVIIHPDPIHATAQFFRGTTLFETGVNGEKTPASFEVHVRKVKSGRDFTYLYAEVVQNVSLRFFSILPLFFPFHMSNPRSRMDGDFVSACLSQIFVSMWTIASLSLPRDKVISAGSILISFLYSR